MSLGGEHIEVIRWKGAWPEEALHVAGRMWSGGAREHYASKIKSLNVIAQIDPNLMSHVQCMCVCVIDAKFDASWLCAALVMWWEWVRPHST